MIDNAPLGDASCPSLSPLPCPPPRHFDSTQLTSAGVLCWLSEADTALGLCAILAGLRVATEQVRPSRPPKPDPATWGRMEAVGFWQIHRQFPLRRTECLELDWCVWLVCRPD